MTKWYIGPEEDERKGPFTDEEILWRINAGEVVSSTALYDDEDNCYSPEEVPAFADRIGNVLVPCGACKARVNAEADTCPKCGKVFRRQPFIIPATSISIQYHYPGLLLSTYVFNAVGAIALIASPVVLITALVFLIMYQTGLKLLFISVGLFVGSFLFFAISGIIWILVRLEIHSRRR